MKHVSSGLSKPRFLRVKQPRIDATIKRYALFYEARGTVTLTLMLSLVVRKIADRFGNFQFRNVASRDLWIFRRCIPNR